MGNQGSCTLENIIMTQFKESYNGYYLQFLPSHVWTNPMHWVQQYDLNVVKNQLFENFLLRQVQPPVHEYIEGPYSLRVLKGKDALNNVKQFYIFGEAHESLLVSQGACKQWNAPHEKTTPFSEFLKTLATTTPQFLDIYLEMPPFLNNTLLLGKAYYTAVIPCLLRLFTESKSKSKMQRAFQAPHKLCSQSMLEAAPIAATTNNEVLLDVALQFSNCVDISHQLLSDPTCLLSRFHLIDIRFQSNHHLAQDNSDAVLSLTFIWRVLLCFATPQHQNTGYDSVLLLDDVLHYKPVTMSTTRFVHSFVKSMLESFPFFMAIVEQENNDSDGVYMLEQVEKHSPLLSKELRSVAPVLRKHILDFVGHTITGVSAFHLWHTFLECEHNYSKLLQVIQDLSEVLFQLKARVLDCYCLSQVFRKFTATHEQPMQPVLPSTYIIYAGNYHSTIYYDFLLHIQKVGEFELTQPPYVTVNSVEQGGAPRFGETSGVSTPCVHLPLEHQV